MRRWRGYPEISLQPRSQSKSTLMSISETNAPRTVSSASESTPGPADVSKGSLTALLGSVVAATTLAGILLHGCGHVAYTSYLKAWGLQPELFPQSTDWKIVRGYYVIVLQGIGLIHSTPWIALIGAFFALWFAIWLFQKPSNQSRSGLLDQFTERYPGLRDIVTSGQLAAIGIYLTITFFLFGLLMATMPGLIGERAGKQDAAREKSQLLGPVERGESELWDGKELKMRGHIIASSPELIAIYDTNLHQVRTLSRGSIEIRAGTTFTTSGHSPN